MKQINFWTLLSLLFLSVAMFSCSENNGFNDDDDNDNNNSSTSDNKLKEGQIELKGYPDSKKTLYFYAKADKITIDWGDGSKIDVITPNGVEVRCSHEYANQNFQTISINTENLTFLSTKYDNNNYYYHYWTEVRIGSCLDLQEANFYNSRYTVLNIKNAPSLTLLNCTGNALTSLDLSACKALTSLNCSNSPSYSNKNQLTASALNTLFQSLPTVESGTISCSDNPGYGTCDKSIAEKKGWKFYY